MTVLIDGKNVEVVIIRKKIKNTYIRVKQDLKVYVTTNILTSDKYISDLIEKNYDYVVRMYMSSLKREVKNSKFFYLGKEYKVVLLNTIKSPKIVEDYIYTKKESDLELFLKKESKKFLTERVKIVYDKMENDNIPYPIVNIRKMVRKWGYCNKSKKLITLNSELIKYDVDDIDYVIVHELVHFIHFDHSKEFWNTVEFYKPDYKINKMHLKE